MASPAAPHVPQFTDDTGALTVEVVDAELRPIAGAWVQSKDGAFNGTTNALGQVGFDFLAPRTYEVRIEADGYRAVVRQVEVRTAQATTLVTTLDAIGAPVPYVTLSQHTGKWDCSVGVLPNPVIKTWGGENCYRGPSEDCRSAICWVTWMSENWTAALVEVGAVPNGGFAARGVQAGVHYRSTPKVGVGWIGCPYQVGWLQFAFAVNTTIDAGARCPYSSQLNEAPRTSNPLLYVSVGPYGGSAPIDYYLAVDQRWIGYVSVFYNQPIPKGYTARPDQ